MIYRAIGLMSGSSLDGLDIAFVSFTEQGGKWSYQIENAATYSYDANWSNALKSFDSLSSREYLLLHAKYGHYLGQQVNKFIDENNLHFKVALIASHGHTSFHMPAEGMTAQLGDGAAIAAETGLTVISDLRSLDVALNGQGAPIVPIGEKFLFSNYTYLLNIGGIANISNQGKEYRAFDICAANRVLNMLARDAGKAYDEDGKIASSGVVNDSLLDQLNALEYYAKPFPKSLANEFGIEVVYPMIKLANISTADAMATYCVHVAEQVKNAIALVKYPSVATDAEQLLITGGGAHNKHLINCITSAVSSLGITVVVPDANIINYKEALIMAFIGVLRFRQENNVLSSVTGAKADSVGGAIWNGQPA